MTTSENLIDFDIIETHKENIQSLPGGRSVKALASAFAPRDGGKSGSTPNATRNLNDAIREEYEIELNAIAESDDPLDIYDRYVKWTLSAYPSAQATPESQLRQLLERATKAFQSAGDYKNDPRYLKLWLHYIRLFSDAPKETFMYIARHNIGERLALFYEEFAQWLEGAGRWAQAEEVYSLGLEREARPVERLQRKSREFKARYDARPQSDVGPSSHALSAMRPALAAKVDPFASSTATSTDPQALQPNPSSGRCSATRAAKSKMAVFSDADATEGALRTSIMGGSRGWDNIGSMHDRKKENSTEARPWAGETLKAGKRSNALGKMSVFKDSQFADQSPKPLSAKPSNNTTLQQVVNARTGKIECVFVNLAAVYPVHGDQNVEISFEELQAESRGWLSKDWSTPSFFDTGPSAEGHMSESTTGTQIETQLDRRNEDDPLSQHETPWPSEEITTTLVTSGEQDAKAKKSIRARKMKVMEIKGETQTIKANLESPTGPKLKRKTSSEPTMTLHTRAATDDILDIFNQPLRNVGLLDEQAESEAETDYDDEDYTSAGESTGTGHISGASECGDATQDLKDTTEQNSDATGAHSVSPWSDFTRSKHLPRANGDQDGNMPAFEEPQPDPALVIFEKHHQHGDGELKTPVSPGPQTGTVHARFAPIPPEDCEAPTHPYRDPEQAAQSRLPFMTPIVEKTESSLGAMTIRDEKDYFYSKTPCRKGGEHSDLNGKDEICEEPVSSPLEEIINEAKPKRHKLLKPSSVEPEISQALQPLKSTNPIISDTQCNPVDDSIRQTILENLSPPLSTQGNFHDHGPRTFGKGSDIRRFIKSLAKSKSSDKTTTNIPFPPSLSFPNSTSAESVPNDLALLTIKRELGKGAFAPVYLGSTSTSQTSDDEPENEELVAIKCEHPPSSWEFYIMTVLQSRLSLSCPKSLPSLLFPYSMHLFSDEGYLLLPYHSQGTLLDLINLSRDSPSDPIAGLDEPIAMFFAVELIRTVQAMHSVGILHGDLKADNCLVRLPTISPPESQLWKQEFSAFGDGGWSVKGLTLIDFGRGIDTTKFSPSAKFIADWKTGKQDCPEMRELRPWTFQGDYWGMAAVIHTLLFGKYIEDVVVMESSEGGAEAGKWDGEERPASREGRPGSKRYKLRETLKRYWATEVWVLVFDILMNPSRHIYSNNHHSAIMSTSLSATSGFLSDDELYTRFPAHNALTVAREKMEEWLTRESGKRGLKVGLLKLEGRLKERERKGGK